MIYKVLCTEPQFFWRVVIDLRISLQFVSFAHAVVALDHFTCLPPSTCFRASQSSLGIEENITEHLAIDYVSSNNSFRLVGRSYLLKHEIHGIFVILHLPSGQMRCFRSATYLKEDS